MEEEEITLRARLNKAPKDVAIVCWRSKSTFLRHFRPSLLHTLILTLFAICCLLAILLLCTCH